MIYKIYTFQYEANKFLYGLGKGHQQYRKKVESSFLGTCLFSQETNVFNVGKEENDITVKAKAHVLH